MRSSPGLWRTWNPATLSWAVFWSGAALVLTALALFTGPRHPAFYGFLIIAWAGTVALVIAPQSSAAAISANSNDGAPHLNGPPVPRRSNCDCSSCRRP
jgi:hypothetical protein